MNIFQNAAPGMRGARILPEALHESNDRSSFAQAHHISEQCVFVIGPHGPQPVDGLPQATCQWPAVKSRTGNKQATPTTFTNWRACTRAVFMYMMHRRQGICAGEIAFQGHTCRGQKSMYRVPLAKHQAQEGKLTIRCDKHLLGLTDWPVYAVSSCLVTAWPQTGRQTQQACFRCRA